MTNEKTNIFTSITQRFLGRSFNLLFGNGIVEYDRMEDDFYFDHTHLNYIICDNTTAENIAKIIFDKLKNEGI